MSNIMDHALPPVSKIQKKALLQGYRVQLVKVSFEHVQAIFDLIGCRAYWII